MVQMYRITNGSKYTLGFVGTTDFAKTNASENQRELLLDCSDHVFTVIKILALCFGT